MAVDETDPPSALQLMVRAAVSASGRARDALDRELQSRTGKTGKTIYDLDRGRNKNPSADVLRQVAEVLNIPLAYLMEPARHLGMVSKHEEHFDPPRSEETGEPVQMVGIRNSDTAFGLGATFTDEASEIQVLQFPKLWVESITYTSPNLLSWVRARGSSMAPTINDGDMILLDHSERRVRDQDELWAYTIGDTRGIKRLRVKGDRFQILSDNPAVPLDEEPIDFVNIVARVIFVGRRT